MPQTIDSKPNEVQLEVAPIKLNLGCGVDAEGKLLDIPGFIGIDRKIGREVYPLDYADGSVDEIRASHVLEHFAQGEVKAVLENWVSKLKPGGVIRIAVPDFRVIAKAYLDGAEIPVMGFIMGGQTDADDFHKTMFDENLLREVLMQCGLHGIRRWESEANDCAKNLGQCSLNLMGFKPSGQPAHLNMIGGILAAPRNGYILHQYCTTKSMAQLPGIEFDVIQSCFWWGELCAGMEKYVKLGKKYILTLDYDSVFEPSDILELYGILESDETIDCAVALQSRRGSEEVLFSFGKDGPRTIASDVFSWRTTQVKTGHFGLTMFRASSLASFPHPWMTPQPGPELRWGADSGAVDVDMNFWHRWEAAGKTLHLANRVAIGHIEEFIKWPSMDGRPVLQTVRDYGSKGKPAECWR